MASMATGFIVVVSSILRTLLTVLSLPAPVLHPAKSGATRYSVHNSNSVSPYGTVYGYSDLPVTLTEPPV